jgi:dihydrodipicolinate synthase/N-acetylneuraminate lyase
VSRIENKYKGVIVPAITPLTDDLRLDRHAVEALFGMFAANGIHPFILGTTGEAASLPLTLREDYVSAAVDYRSPGMILYAGISSNVLQESVDFAVLCARHGVDVAVATVPSYYALTEDQTERFFTALADAIPLPLIIYNIPATTHVSLSLELLDRLSHHPNIVGVKDSERSDERMHRSLALWRDRVDFSYLLGWAARSADALAAGGDGIIPSTGNLVPEIYRRMLKSIASGDLSEAQSMQHLSDAYGALYQSGRTLGESLAALKSVMHHQGICGKMVMPPLTAMDDGSMNMLAQAFDRLIRDGSATISL